MCSGHSSTLKPRARHACLAKSQFPHLYVIHASDDHGDGRGSYDYFFSCADTNGDPTTDGIVPPIP